MQRGERVVFDFRPLVDQRVTKVEANGEDMSDQCTPP
jgi:hypothetical protein